MELVLLLMSRYVNLTKMTRLASQPRDSRDNLVTRAKGRQLARLTCAVEETTMENIHKTQ